MNSPQFLNIEYIQGLSSQYQKANAANTRMDYLKSYTTMLSLEIEQMESMLYQNLLDLKKNKRFLRIKKVFKGAYNLDEKINNLKSEVESLILKIKDKHKEKESTEFEMQVLIQLCEKREYIQKEYHQKLELLIANYTSKSIEEHVALSLFERRLNDLFVSHIKTTYLYDKLKELKDLLDQVHPLFMQMAYGYQDESTSDSNVKGANLVKRVNELANSILIQVNEIWDEGNLPNLSFLALDRENVQINLSSLAKFRPTFFSQDSSNSYALYNNTLTSLRVRVGNDLANVKRDQSIIEDKLNNVTKERQAWFKKLFKLI